MCSPPNTWFSGLTNKPSGFSCSSPNTQFFRLTKNSVVLYAHHQILGIKAHQKSSSFFVLITNTYVQFRDGQSLLEFTSEYKKAPSRAYEINKAHNRSK